MGYRSAYDILPFEVLELIQQYTEGEIIYIPKRKEHKKAWGTNTNFRSEIDKRNQNIARDHNLGLSVSELAVKYFLSEKSIQRIIRQTR